MYCEFLGHAFVLHAVRCALVNDGASHTTHTDEPLLGVYLPTSHTKHVVALKYGLKWPGAHNSHAV